jgi:hypothetical protein
MGQGCDPIGHWYLPYNDLDPGDLLLLIGRALQQATAGLQRACVYHVVPVAPTAMPFYLGRCVLLFICIRCLSGKLIVGSNTITWWCWIYVHLLNHYVETSLEQ